MANRIRFYVYEVLSGKPLGELDPQSYSFNDPVWGAGSFNCVHAIPNFKAASSLRTQTNPDQVQLYIVLDDSIILWGGVIDGRPRKPGSQLITITAQHWKAWYYTRLFHQRIIYDADEFAIVYALMDYAMSDYGCPVLKRGTNLAGKTRQLTIEPGWSVGKAMDSLGQRDGGFEWSIGLRYSSVTGQPEQYLELWEPGAPRGTRNLLSLSHSTSNNRISVGDISEDATERRPRVWAASQGTWPDITIVEDHDPELTSGRILLREEYITPSGVIEAPTLYDHARAERLGRAAPVSTIPVDHPYDSPSIANYRSGDRARLQIRDEWDNLDVPGVRIVDRAISKAKDGMPIATVQLDMLDVSNITGGGI